MDSDDFDFFPSSPTSHIFTSPPPEEPFLKRPTLPLELIEYIIELFHQRYRSFRVLRAFSEASSQFRMIVMRRYMSSLRIYSAKQLSSLSKLHISMLSRRDTARECVGFHWVKSFMALSGDLAKAPWNPSVMCNLRALQISFAADATSTQKNRLVQIFVIPLMNSPMAHLTSLTLTDLWHIDVSLLNVVADAFQGLTSLHLSCSERLDVSCCWTCFEESSSTVIHSPIPDHFPTVESLTSAFGEALKPLTKLNNLHLGIFLSNKEILENHIDHYDSPRSGLHLATFDQNLNLARSGTVLSQSESPSTARSEHASYGQDEEDAESPGVVFGEVPPFPHGPELCPICSTRISAANVPTRELEAGLALAQELKSLRTIGWSSFFASKVSSADEQRIGDWRRATKIYVLRNGGRVHVRRRPWK